MAEFLIDSILVGNGSKRHKLSWLSHVSEDIRLIKMQIEEKTVDIGCLNAVETTKREIPHTSKVGADEDVLVLEDQQQMIVNHLIRGSSQRDTVSIVGMAGIGKTTLANKVYNDPEIVSQHWLIKCKMILKLCLTSIFGHVVVFHKHTRKETYSLKY
ncbi:putative late blight resistance protein homolog R1B-16 [Coffea arabica]|uniref:Late blight resistance protein homolog R1B-16 n=1 Tax=Coffea arabica TaxID=13443 RepID=A0ABM4W8W4_COFAR